VKKNLWFMFAVILILSLSLAACGGAATQAPTQEPTVEQMATEQPTAEQQMATEQPTAEQMATEQPTAEQMATEQPTAEQMASGEAVTIDVWFHSGKGPERDALNATIDKFNSTHAVQVNAIQLPEGSYNDQVNAGALAGDLPCALDFDGPNLYNYAWSGYLIPIDDYVSDEMRSDFLSSIIDQGTYAGNLYSLGQFDSGLAIWANKAYLEKAGVRIPKGVDDVWSKEEFVDALDKLQALDEVEYAIDFKMNYGQGEWYTYGFSPIIWSFGGSLIDRSNYQTADGYLNSQESIDAMKFFQSLFQDGYTKAEPAGDDDFYINKIAALSWVGHWMWEPHHENMGDNVILIPMPDFGVGPKTGMGSWNWGITSNCENPDAAWTFLDFILSKDEILRMTNANGAVPARQSAIAESDLYAPDGPLNLFVQQLQTDDIAVPRPIYPGYPVLTSAFQEAVQNIVSGADVQEELDKAVKTIDQDIQDNQGYPAPQM
jgi:multiple sugar transport system substrate-binding protein